MILSRQASTHPGSYVRGESNATPPCKRCGIDLPKTRFLADGRTLKKDGKWRSRYPFYCSDCVSIIRREDRERELAG